MSYLEAKGWLTKAERQLLYWLAIKAPRGGSILNIGVEYGASVHCLYEGNPSAYIYAVDIDLSKAQLPAGRIQLMQQDSAKLIHNWQHLLNLAFIDGDHTEAGTFADAQYSRFIQPGGYIAFHDCYAWEGGPHKTCPEVNLAVDKWFLMQPSQWHELPAVDSIRYFQKE